ncbi:hypothetical protein WAI453_007996 [Rhynchosporium graminicola]
MPLKTTRAVFSEVQETCTVFHLTNIVSPSYESDEADSSGVSTPSSSGDFGIASNGSQSIDSIIEAYNNVSQGISSSSFSGEFLTSRHES